MCGIVGAIANRNVKDILIEGLKREDMILPGLHLSLRIIKPFLVIINIKQKTPL